MATQEDIEFHYDVDNDFYSLFLDKEFRVYTCAVWDGANDLQQAQVNKLKRISQYAKVNDGHKVMDVGCGWGGLMHYITKQYKGAQAHGVTLSSKQTDYVKSMNFPKVTVDNVSWEDYVAPDKKYDAIVSVCALEHFATYEVSEAGLQRDLYKKFFDWCLNISTEDAYIGIQSIILTRFAENITELQSAKFLKDEVFPGSALASISDIQAGIQDKYEIVESTTVGLDYVLTLKEWDKNFESNKTIILEKYGKEIYDHYKKYFECAINCFETGYWSVYQASLKRAKPTRAFRPK
jgi:cyclopropane-fatty-acyl-phospholipid synthase